MVGHEVAVRRGRGWEADVAWIYRHGENLAL